jgi:hypothetical protein
VQLRASLESNVRAINPGGVAAWCAGARALSRTDLPTERPRTHPHGKTESEHVTQVGAARLRAGEGAREPLTRSVCEPGSPWRQPKRLMARAFALRV